MTSDQSVGSSTFAVKSPDTKAAKRLAASADVFAEDFAALQDLRTCLQKDCTRMRLRGGLCGRFVRACSAKNVFCRRFVRACGSVDVSADGLYVHAEPKACLQSQKRVCSTKNVFAAPKTCLLWIGHFAVLSELGFAPSGASPTPNAVLPNIEIDLSTTSKAPDGLSTTFADNVGANDVVVHSGSLNFFLSELGVYRIMLQTPSLFDPTAGNLLLDVRNFQTIPPPLEGYEVVIHDHCRPFPLER